MAWREASLLPDALRLIEAAYYSSPSISVGSIYMVHVYPLEVIIEATPTPRSSRGGGSR
jgi:hypothetical protein